MKRITLLFLTAACLLFAGVGPAFAQVDSACDNPYVVTYGDTLGAIAQACGVTLEAILSANPQITNPNLVVVGQQLQIPHRRATEPQPQPIAAPEEVAPLQTMNSDREDAERIIDRPALDSGAGAEEDNPTGEDAPAAGIPVTGSTESVQKTYQVQAGDSLGRIAAREGLTVNQIMFVNPDLLNPNLIYPGQVLNIPPSTLTVPEDEWKNQRIQRAAALREQVVRNFSPAVGERWIYVDLATQTVHAYEGSQIVRSFLVSTGLPRTPTVTGEYRIWTKMRTDDMSGPGYDLKDVPYVMYFYRGYGLHGTYWHNNFGMPMSHGCVNLATPDAEWLYNFASVGTVVKVQ